MPAPRAGFIMLRLMFAIGRRRTRFPILKVIDVVKAARLIGSRFFWKFIAIVPSAMPGSDAISAREITSVPVMTPVAASSPVNGFFSICSEMSGLPVSIPKGEVPAVPSVKIVA